MYLTSVLLAKPRAALAFICASTPWTELKPRTTVPPALVTSEGLLEGLNWTITFTWLLSGIEAKSRAILDCACSPMPVAMPRKIRTPNLFRVLAILTPKKCLLAILPPRQSVCQRRLNRNLLMGCACRY